MKKFLLFASLLALIAGLKSSYAGETVAAPAGEISNPINADYGGVDISTVPDVALLVSTVASLAITTNTYYGNRHWRVYGVLFSTGQCGNMDFVSVFQSTSGFLNRTEMARFYNVYNSTNAGAGAGGSGAVCSGAVPMRWPIRLNGNLFIRNSAGGYTNNSLLYWKEPD